MTSEWMIVSSRGEQAVQALSRFGELAWFKLPTEFNSVYGYAQVPYMGWRYAFPEEGVAQLIEAAVRALPTQVDWEIDRTRRNWVLVPTRILLEAHGLADPSFRDVVHSINVQDQEFCLKALSDFEIIIQHLLQVDIPED
ncbi:hypothetical protein ACFYWX_05990 [Streptomyces sp. NPDC002888]|uniref:hypothetical protein n=1 Tax=Streptomyces sp. NPDC002888 TaxID=3364668 RepID=UPI0036794D7E